MILQAHSSLREADAVLAEESRAEELVRGQHLQQRILAEHRPGHIAAEDPAGKLSSDPDLLADDDIRPVSIRVVAQRLERAVEQVVVLIDELDIRAVRLVDASIARRARPARMRQRENAHVRTRARDLRQA